MEIKKQAKKLRDSLQQLIYKIINLNSATLL